VKLLACSRENDSSPPRWLQVTPVGQLNLSTAHETCSFTCDEWYPLFYGLLDGLQHVQAWSVIHRDIRPHNVVFVGDRLVLIDFGVAICNQVPFTSRVFAGNYLPRSRRRGVHIGFFNGFALVHESGCIRSIAEFFLAE